MHIAHERTRAGKAASRSAAGNRRVLPAERGSNSHPRPPWHGWPPRGERRTARTRTVPASAAGAGQSPSPPAASGVNDGVTVLFHLQSWAPAVPSLSPELSHCPPCSPSTLIPRQANSAPAPRSLLQSENEPPRPRHRSERTGLRGRCRNLCKPSRWFPKCGLASSPWLAVPGGEMHPRRGSDGGGRQSRTLRGGEKSLPYLYFFFFFFLGDDVHF